MTQRISRRQFLRAAAASGAAVFLSACASQDIIITPLISGGPAASAPGGVAAAAATKPAAAPPPADTSKNGIKLMLRGGRGIINQAAVDAWNKNSKSQATLATSSGGITNDQMITMIQDNIASGNQPWDGYATITSPWDLANWVKNDVVVPLDSLVKASSTPGAGLVVPALVPAIKDSLTYDGKIYGIPANVGSVAFVYYPQVLKDAGYERQLQTWDDIHTAGLQVKANNPNVNPFFSSSSPLTDMWAWMWSAMADPFDPDGLIDIRSPEALDALDWLRRMADDGLTPNFQEGGGGYHFQHSTAMMVAQDSFSSSSFVPADDPQQPQMGKPVVSYGLAPKQGSPNAGVPFWVNLCVVVNKSKNPQGMVDFYLWLFGLDNKDVGKQIAQSAPKPCYTYTYTEFVQTNPDLAWQQAGIDLVAKSKPFPFSGSHTRENDITQTHIRNLLDTTRLYTRQLAVQEMQAAYDEIKAGIKS